MANEFLNQFEKDKEEASKGRVDWYKFKEGNSKIRILETPVKFFETYTPAMGYLQLWHECGLEGNLKYLTRVWVYEKDKDGVEKNYPALLKMPLKIMDPIIDMMRSDEYAFTEFPMPYDITVKAENAGTKEVSYTVIAARANTEVPAEALQSLEGQTPLVEILEKMKEKSKKKYESGGSKSSSYDTIEYPTEDINPKDIPF